MFDPGQADGLSASLAQFPCGSDLFGQHFGFELRQQSIRLPMSLACRERPPVKRPDGIFRHACAIPVKATHKELGVGISVFSRRQPMPERCLIVVGLVGRQSGIQCNAQWWGRSRCLRLHSLRLPSLRLPRFRLPRFRLIAWFFGRRLNHRRIALAVWRSGRRRRGGVRWRVLRWCSRGANRILFFDGKSAGFRTVISDCLGICRPITTECRQFPGFLNLEEFLNPAAGLLFSGRSALLRDPCSGARRAANAPPREAMRESKARYEGSPMSM